MKTQRVKSPMKRRQFLKRSTAATAFGLGIASASRVLGANDRVRVAVIGLRWRGGDHIAGFLGLKGVEVAALCDVDESVLADRVGEVEKRVGTKPAAFIDVRKLFEDSSIDAVGIANQNHWHSLAGIWAMQAGKHVYLEKPCSHNIWEGRQLTACAKKTGRICQHGTQIRSSAAIREAIRLLGEGVIGDLYMAKGLCYKWRATIGRAKEEPVPPGVHYDLWLGPAPVRPFTRNRFHYNWHWNWDYGNGDIGNQGVHQMDVARWGLGLGLPSRIQSMGDHFMFDDDQETPNTQVAAFHYPDQKKMLVFEVRHWITNGEDVGKGGAVGNIFFGTEGIMIMPSYTSYRVLLGRNHEPGPARDEGGDHFGNFIEAVRAGDATMLNAPIEEGHLSSALCHLANVAYRTQRTIRFDPATETCIGDDEANALVSRTYRDPFVVPRIV